MLKIKTLSIFTLAILLGVNGANAYETKARNAILMDAETGEYLFVKDHEQMIFRYVK